jgi:hypothetical protein
MEADILRLFVGPGVTICNECVDLLGSWDDEPETPVDDAQVLEGLSASDRQVAVLRLGFDGQRVHTVEEIAGVLGISVTESRVLTENAIQGLIARRRAETEGEL